MCAEGLLCVCVYTLPGVDSAPVSTIKALIFKLQQTLEFSGALIKAVIAGPHPQSNWINRSD
jgi:hypothetical protein